MRIKEITALRGIFMVMIFLFHEHVYEGGGTLGVTFFFILSGFSLTLGYYDKIIEGSFDYKSFLQKRLAKFLPLHWLTLLAAVALVIINVYLTSFQPILIPTFFANVFLVQSWVPLESYYLSYNSVSWYLCNTFFYVVLFPYIVRWINRTERKKQCAFAIILFFLYTMLYVIIPDSWCSPIFYINPVVRLLDFVIGIYLALWVKQRFISTTRNENRISLSILYTVTFALLISIFIISVLLVGNLKKYSVSFCYWPFICALIVSVCIIGFLNLGGAFYKTKFYYGLVKCHFLSIWFIN